MKQRHPLHVPSRGDICWFDLEPVKSRQEFGKTRPGLVISATEYNKDGPVCVVVPITTQDEHPTALDIVLPGHLKDAQTGHPLRGLIACAHPRSINYRQRHCRFSCRIDDTAIMNEVISNLLDLIDPT